MKNLLLAAALILAVSPAFASKARYGALGFSAHLTDTQSIWTNPVHMHKVGQFATFEMGQPNGSVPNAAPYNEKAEGGFLMNSSFGVWGAYLGHRSETVTEFVSGINQQLTGGGNNGLLLTEQNPLDLLFGGDMGGMKWGAYLHYSSSKNDALDANVNGADAKISTAGAGFGLAGENWDAFFRVGLNGQSEATATAPGPIKTELKQKGLYSIGGGYWMENNYLFGSFVTAKGDFTAATTTTEIEKTEYTVGIVNNNPVAGGNVFYGVSYLNNETKNGNTKSTKSRLPVVLGMEVDAASWLVLRGSVTQSVLIGENKSAAATNNKKELVNSTTVAAGAGIKFGKLTLDGLISHTPNTNNSAVSGTEANIPNSNGTISGTGTLTQASLTYMF